MKTAAKVLARKRRQARVRKKVRGSNERPRLCVYRSNRHIYAQVISDETGRTLVAASTLSAEIRERAMRHANRAAARIVGEEIAAKCREVGIRRVVFDRNGFLYHGCVKELAEAARSGGLEF